MRTLLLALSVCALSGCSDRSSTPGSLRVTLAQFQQLRWIAGDWRGSGTAGTVQSPFYERYRFPDDSTLIVETFTDSTWRTASDSSRYGLRAGRLGNLGGSARWIATSIDSLGVTFARKRTPGTGFGGSAPQPPIRIRRAGSRRSLRWATRPGRRRNI